jgi:hypothetical protein
MGLLFALLQPVPSFAEITFYVLPEGDKGFIIEGDDINAAAGVELTVVYDSNFLAHPRVRMTQGTVTDIDDSVPGTVIIKAIQGDDSTQTFEAHLSFDKTKDIQGGIFSVRGKIMQTDGTDSPSRTIPGESAELSSSSFLSTAAYHDGETASNPEQSVTTGKTEKTALSGNSADIFSRKEKNVLQRFKDFRGERGLKAFVALFEQKSADLPVQEPPVVLSDGKTLVRIRFPFQPEEEDTPNIALSDAKLVDMRKEGKKGWVITAMPKEGTWNAGLIIMGDEKTIEFPLVVAPPVKIHETINEQNFVAELDRFLSDQVGAGKGEIDPLRQIPHEYIFTANYLASSGNTTAKMTSGLNNPMSESK